MRAYVGGRGDACMCGGEKGVCVYACVRALNNLIVKFFLKILLIYFKRDPNILKGEPKSLQNLERQNILFSHVVIHRCFH